MSTQLDFLDEFDRHQRRREVRHEIIDSSSASREVKSLLHMLSDFTQSVIGEGGDTHVTVSIPKIAERMNRSRNTVRKYIAMACETPYFEVLDPDTNDDKRTYIIHWRSIIDREPIESKQRHAGSTAAPSQPQYAGSTAADGTDSIASGGGQTRPPRGSIPQSEGVNSGFEGGQNGGQLTPFNLLKTGEPVLQRDLSKTPVKPVLKTGAGGQNETDRLPEDLGREVPAKWRMAIASRDLNDHSDIEELYGIAVALGLVNHSQISRDRIYTQACVDTRLMRESKFYTRNGVKRERTAGSIFRENVLYRRWGYCSAADIDEATRLIRLSDELVPCADPDDERERQKKLLNNSRFATR